MDDAQAPLVSIIISSYNDRENLYECLSSLRKLNYPRYEVIVVDAGSTDGTPEMVKENFPEVRLVEAGRIGIGEAINTGIRHARGDYLVLELNTDEVVDKDWLRALVRAMDSSSDVGIVVGKRLVYDTNTMECVAGGVRYLTGRLTCMGERSGGTGGRRATEDLEWACIFLVKRKVIERIGLFDEDYYIYLEDIDFCLRARRAGFKIVFTPDALSWHKGQAVIGKRSHKRYYYLYRNTIRLVIKNFDIPYMISSLVWWLAIRPFLYAIFAFPPIRRLVSAVFPGSAPQITLGQLWVLLKAIVWNIRNLRRTIQSRYKHLPLCRRKVL